MSFETLDATKANSKWKTEPEMLHAVSSPYVVHLSNSVYVIGGDVSGLGSIPNSRHTQKFNHLGGTWSNCSPMPGVCSNGCALVFREKIYVLGGEEKVCFSYDPAQNPWTLLSRPPINAKKLDSLHDCCATVWQGRILLNVNTWHGTYVYLYDPVKDRWNKKESLFVTNHETLLLFTMSPEMGDFRI